MIGSIGRRDRTLTVGETYDCEASDGTEFVGEVVAIVLEGHDLAINFRLSGGSGNWEDWT